LPAFSSVSSLVQVMDYFLRPCVFAGGRYYGRGLVTGLFVPSLDYSYHYFYRLWRVNRGQKPAKIELLLIAGTNYIAGAALLQFLRATAVPAGTC